MPNSQIDLQDNPSLEYTEESIGRLMKAEYVAIHPEVTVAHALSHIRQHGKECATLETIYIIDAQGTLVGDVRLREIILAAPDQRVSEILDDQFSSLTAAEDQEIAVKRFQELDALALPVVDAAGVMLGIITVDDVMDVAEQESLEDFQKFSSIQHAITNPIKARIVHLYRERIVWLSALVVMIDLCLAKCTHHNFSSAQRKNDRNRV